MNVLVFGGTGFIGPPLVRRLRELDHDVAVFHRGSAPGCGSGTDGIPHIHGDRADVVDHRDAFATFAPDVAIDMRAMNAADAERLLDAIGGITRRAVLVSSVDVYRAYGRFHGTEPGPTEPMPLTEESPLRERLHPYRGEGNPDLDDYDKIPIERLYMDRADLTGSVIRLPAVHGEGDYQHRVGAELRVTDGGHNEYKIPAAAMQWRWSRGYVGNIADAIALVATDARAAGRIYHVAEPDTPTQREWVEAIARAAGWRGRVVTGTGAPTATGAMNFAQDIVVDSSRIRRELGYSERVSPEEGVARAVAWERADRASLQHR